MNIRLAKKEDFEDYFGLMCELYISEIKTSKKDPYLKLYLQKPREKELRKEFSKMLNKHDSFFLVSEDNGKVVGFQYGFIDYYVVDKKRNHFGHLDTLVVSKEYRGGGIGTNLLKKSFRWFKDKGLKWCMLRVDNDNNLAVSLYKKLGFYPTELRMVKRI